MSPLTSPALATLLAMAAGLDKQGLFAPQNPPPSWGDMRTPSQGPTESIGTYAAGCLRGADSLSWDGPGYHVVRVSRNRYFAHPEFLDFVRRFGERVRQEGIGDFLVGDLSQPRGGPMLQGHNSHQMGLDGDFWFHTLPANTDPLDPRHRDRLHTASLLRADGRGIDRRQFNATHVALLHEATQDPRVARVFVNPHIKKELCRILDPSQNAWLHRLRPWWGHDSHFHVRLQCPPSLMKCESQPEPPEGPGCDSELDGWFEPDGRVKAPPPPQPDRKPQLPPECADLLTEKPAP